MAEPAISDALDHMLGGRLALLQSRTGHRSGTDAVLLAAVAAATLREGGGFVDVGSGTGAAGLALALRDVSIRGILLEREPEAARLARSNCALNGLEGRVLVAEADLFSAAARRDAGLVEERADLVLTNPPFHLAGDVRPSPDGRRAVAHVLAGRDHGAWLKAATALLAPGGRFVAIHRPEALPDLLTAATGRLGALVLRPVQAREWGDAIRILISGIKGSRAPMRIATPFILHGPDGAFTAEAEAVHRGETFISV